MRIDIVYTIDVQGGGAYQFMNQLITGLYAIRKFKREEDEIVVHILYANLHSDAAIHIMKLQRRDFTIEFRKISDVDLNYLQQFSKYPVNSNVRQWSGIVYARIFIANIYKDLPKALYLDVDTLVLRSLHELYSIDLKDNLFGMNMGVVPEYGFNSGVMLMNLDGIRKEPDVWKRLDEHMKAFAKSYYCPDQTVINRFFAGKILPIDRKFNYPPTGGRPTDLEGLKNAVVLHFYNQQVKPYKIDVDDVGKTLLVWNNVLNEAERAMAGHAV